MRWMPVLKLCDPVTYVIEARSEYRGAALGPAAVVGNPDVEP